MKWPTWFRRGRAGDAAPVAAQVSLDDLRVTTAITAADIRRQLGPEFGGWDDGVECNLQYATAFGSVEFSCATEAHGPDRAFLRYVNISRDPPLR